MEPLVGSEVYCVINPLWGVFLFKIHCFKHTRSPLQKQNVSYYACKNSYKYAKSTGHVTAELTNHSRFQINEESSRNELSWPGLVEERRQVGAVAVITLIHLGLLVDAAVRVEAVLQAVELPAGVSDLYTSLSDMKRDDFTL